MANEFIARKGLIALENSQISGSLSVTNSVTASFFTGSYRGDGSQLTGIEGFPFTGSAKITGSLEVTGSVIATTFIGDGSQLTGIADPTPITATIDNTNSPFTITSQSIVIIDSTNGDVTVNLPDLDTIVGTSNQKPILLYKNDYSQNVVYVEPSGSQLVNGTTQDIIVSIQIAIAYNPTSAGWVTEGTSYQSLAELEMFFVPRTETGSFATTGSNQFSGSQTITGSLTVTGNITGNITGSASTASYVEYTNVANKPALVSGSSQITYSGLTGIPSGIISGSAQIASFGIFATTGSNQFNGNQSITGSLTVTGQVVAQTLNVQQVTSSIVFSSGSNIFGNSLANTQQFTGSVGVTGSLTVAGAGTFTTSITPLILKSTNATTMWTEYYYNTSTLSGYIGSGGGILSGANTSDFIIRSEADFVVATGGNNRRLTIASTGAATFNTTATTAVSAISTGTASGLQLTNSGGTASSWIIQSDGGAVAGQAALRFYSLTASAYRMSIDGNGNVGINTTSPASRLNVAGAKTNSADLTNAANQLAVTDTTATAAGVGGRISFLGSYTATPDYLTFGAIEVLKDNANNYGSASWNNAAMRFIVGNNDNDANAGRMLERMRITSGGNVGIGLTNPQYRLHVSNSNTLEGTIAIGDDQYPGLIYASAQSGEFRIDNRTSAAGGYITFYPNGQETTLGSEAMRINASGNVLIGTTSSPTLSTPHGGKLLMLPNAVIVSGIIAFSSPYSQNIQIDIVYGNWGSNSVIGLVDMIITLREYAHTSGTAFGKIFATNSAQGSTFTSFNTTDVTASQCSITATSGGSYTLRITIDPSNVTDRGSFYLVIPSGGGTGSEVSSITVSYV